MAIGNCNALTSISNDYCDAHTTSSVSWCKLPECLGSNRTTAALPHLYHKVFTATGARSQVVLQADEEDRVRSIDGDRG